MTDDDQALLLRFAATRDEAVFAVLVERHQALVMGACRRVLGDVHDAEDAAQAVFFILATKAGAIDASRSLTPWLHRVATNVALNTLKARRVREYHHREAAAMPRSEIHSGLSDELDAALCRLPERERTAIVLFHIEGRSLEEIAGTFRKPVATVGYWLQRGRERLRALMGRRGIALSATALISGLGSLPAVELPAGFAAATAKAATAFAIAGTATTPAAIFAVKGCHAMKFAALFKSAVIAAAVTATLGVAGFAVAAESGGKPKANANPNAPLGSPDFIPTPQRPTGWRGDWTGRYPGATPPLSWSRRVKGITSEIAYQAKKPSGEAGKDALPLEYFTIKDWLVAGPFDGVDPKQDIDKDFLGGEATVQPNDGDKVGSVTWKSVHAGIDTQAATSGSQCDHLSVDFVNAFGKFSRDAKLQTQIDGDFVNKVAYAHTYIHSPSGGKVDLTTRNWGAATKAWLNGQPLAVAVETDQNVWSKKDIEVTLAKGWNRLLIKVASGTASAKGGFSGTGSGMVGHWRCAAYVAPLLPVSYETKNVAWMTLTTGRSMSQPIVVGDRIFVGSAISDLMCISKTDGKVLWIRSCTPWDALSPEERPQFKDKIEPLATQLEQANDQAVTAINAMVSPQGMSSDQQAELHKRLKDKLDLETKIHEAFKAIDGKRFPPLTGNEVASSNATPCSDGVRVYWACGGGMKGTGASVVSCFDLAGKRIWSYHEAFGAAEHGLHTSPLLADGKLVYGGAHWLIGFDAVTGKVAWKQKCDEFCGASPQPVKLGNETAVLLKPAGAAGHTLALVRPSDGATIASLDFVSFGEETPAVENGVVYIPDHFKNFNNDNVAFTAVQLPASAAPNSAMKQLFELKWQDNNVQWRGSESYWVASSLYLDGLVYAVDESGGLMIVDVKAQKSVYRGWLDWYCRFNRYQYGAVASPTLGGKNIYLVDDAGYTIVVKPGPAYQELGRNVLENITPIGHIGENPCKQELFYTAPVFVGDVMYLRGEEYLYAIRGK